MSSCHFQEADLKDYKSRRYLIFDLGGTDTLLLSGFTIAVNIVSYPSFPLCNFDLLGSILNLWCFFLP